MLASIRQLAKSWIKNPLTKKKLEIEKSVKPVPAAANPAKIRKPLQFLKKEQKFKVPPIFMRLAARKNEKVFKRLNEKTSGQRSKQLMYQCIKTDSSVDVSNFLSDNSCLLRGNSFNFAILFPVGFMTLFITITFITVFATTDLNQEFLDKITLKHSLLVAVATGCLVCAAWVTGYFLLLSDNIAFFTKMNWIFTATVSTQGLVMLILICVGDENVRKSWWPWVCREIPKLLIQTYETFTCSKRKTTNGNDETIPTSLTTTRNDETRI